MYVGDGTSETGRNRTENEDSCHADTRAIAINDWAHDQTDAESRGEGDDVGVSDLRSGQLEVLTNGFGDQGRESEPREESDEEASVQGGAELATESYRCDGVEREWQRTTRRDGSCASGQIPS